MKRALLSSIFLLLAACTPKAPTLPSGSGMPFPEFASAYEDAVARCRAVRTFSAALNLSGRAGRTKLRGTIHAGFEAPDALRLEGVGPFGRTVFVLVARGTESTLLLPRDDRVLRNAPPSAIVEALAGVALAPAELRAVLAGCGLGVIQPQSGRAYERGWAAVDNADGTTVYLQQVDGRWQVAGAARGPIAVQYSDFSSDRPSTVKVRTSAQSAGAADLTVRISQVEINVALAPAVFEVDVPRDAVPLTLDELRRAGPLGEAQSTARR